MSIAWFGVDWGSTHLRAWAFDDAGCVQRVYFSAKGAATLQSSEFEGALLDLIGADLPTSAARDVLCCGMVGARQGWVEAPYRQTPARLTPAPSETTCFEAAAGRLRICLLPGIAQLAPADVMRGEETQILGLRADADPSQKTLCLPGTHSKWVQVNQGKVTTFKTFPTGELFALLSENSVLRHSVTHEEMCMTAFRSAVLEALQPSKDLLGQLFPIRAHGLLAEDTPAAARGRLSGLLIGQELAAARPYWEGQDVTLIGAHKLAQTYLTALAEVGVTTHVIDGEDAVCRGLRAAWTAMQRVQA